MPLCLSLSLSLSLHFCPLFEGGMNRQQRKLLSIIATLPRPARRCSAGNSANFPQLSSEPPGHYIAHNIPCVSFALFFLCFVRFLGRTIKIYCQQCTTLLFKYRKQGKGQLVKTFLHKIVQDHTKVCVCFSSLSLFCLSLCFRPSINLPLMLAEILTNSLIPPSLPRSLPLHPPSLTHTPASTLRLALVCNDCVTPPLFDKQKPPLQEKSR